MALLESEPQLQKGSLAPDFDLEGTDGQRHTLASYARYDALLVVFMCNHCPYVKAKIEALKELHAEYGSKVAVVGINSNDAVRYPDDSFENMKKTASERGIKFDYLIDEGQDVARRYGAACTPDPFLFGKDRRLVFHGRIDDAMTPGDEATERTMAQNIGQLLEGGQIEKDFDPSIGCSIKWREN